MPSKWKKLLDEEQTKRERNLNSFMRKMTDFPCTFNLGNVNLDIFGQPYNGKRISQPDVNKDKWNYMKDNLDDDDNADDDNLEEIVWKENLLTRVFAELGEHEKAKELNSKVLKKFQENLTALANSAFLYFTVEDTESAFKVIKLLDEKKNTSEFAQMKIDAVCEQGYVYRKLGGADNLVESLKLLDVVAPFKCNDDKVQFMIALVYRRCTRYQIFTMRPDAIDPHKFSQLAAQGLYKIQAESHCKSLKAAALVELAFLKHPDDVIHYGSFQTDKDKALLTEKEWEDIVGPVTWQKLADDALMVEETPSVKVLKIAGQLFKYSHEYKKAKDLLCRSISIKPSNRAHHHLGLIYRAEAIKYERQTSQQTNESGSASKSALSDMSSMMKSLPGLPAETKEFSLRLKLIVKVPYIRILPFTDNNPFTEDAVYHLKKAVELSHNQNTAAMYDLATLLAQMGRYKDSVNMCGMIVAKSQPILHIINAFELCGMVQALMAACASDEKEKQYHIEENEYMLTQAVHWASHLASDIPELSTCATDIWNAFTHLQKKFIFDGDTESKRKLFKLCELVADHRHLQVLDEILSKDEAEWNNKDALEAGLKRYMNLNNCKGAMLLLDMIQLRSKAKNLLTWKNCATVRKIKLEFAKMMFCRDLKTIDPVWKAMFKAEFDSPATFDIVIVDDQDDYADTFDGRSENLSCSLKEILAAKCGLNVTRAHEGVPGQKGFELDLRINTIYNSQVAVIVWDYESEASNFQPKETDSDNMVVTDSQQSPCSLNGPSNPDPTQACHFMDQEGAMLSEVVTVDKSGRKKQCLEHLISTCVCTHVEDKMPKHLLTIVLGTENKVPHVLRGYKVITMSDENIKDLSELAAGGETLAGIDCFMEVFQAVVRQDKNSE